MQFLLADWLQVSARDKNNLVFNWKECIWMMGNCSSSRNIFRSCFMENWLTLSQPRASVQWTWIYLRLEKKSVKQDKALLLLDSWHCASEPLEKQSSVQVRQLCCYLVAWSSTKAQKPCPCNTRDTQAGQLRTIVVSLVLPLTPHPARDGQH